MRKSYDFSKAKRGAIVKPKGKTRITIYLDDEVIESYRQKGDKTGRGYQTLINDALRETLSNEQQAIDAKTIRRIIREELEKAG
ncbi:MAG: BrnA antitoxin family protein [Gammaproteobacteria bacterium]|nr:BrnA antitoxin family protein [Gammaproteobacteria bacterium]